MDNGIRFEGNAAFPDITLVRATGQELRDLIDVAYGAHLNQANIGKLIDAFTSKAGGVPGITDATISNVTFNDSSRLAPEEPEIPTSDPGDTSSPTLPDWGLSTYGYPTLPDRWDLWGLHGPTGSDWTDEE